LKTKQKILNAALSILAEQGYQALTQTRVAAAAGVRQGLLTYHFPTRAALLKAVVEETKAQTMQSLFDAQAPLTLENLKNCTVKMALSNAFPRMMLALSVAADEDSALGHWFADADRSVRESFRLGLAHLGLQVDELELHGLRAIVVGAALIHLQQNTHASEQVARAVLDRAFTHLLNCAQPL
jgi:AcrR family transcriptional regulator